MSNVETMMKKYMDSVIRGNADERSLVILKAVAFDSMAQCNATDVVSMLILLTKYTSDAEERANYIAKALRTSKGDQEFFMETCKQVAQILGRLDIKEIHAICKALYRMGGGNFVNLFFEAMDTKDARFNKEDVLDIITNKVETVPKLQSYRVYSPESTSIESYMYSAETKNLWITFKSNPKVTYLYTKVPEHVAKGLHTAKSKGQFVSEFIVKAGYDFIKQRRT